MLPIVDAAATLGGRFNLIFDPRRACLYQNAFGAFRERPLDLLIGVRTADGDIWALPFTTKADHLPYVEQFDTLTTIAYRGVHPSLGFELVMRIRAPFYPGNIEISTSPLCYMDIQVRPGSVLCEEECTRPLEAGELLCELDGEGVDFARSERGFQYTFRSAAPGCYGPAGPGVEVDSWLESADTELFSERAFSKPFDLSTADSAHLSLVWSSWVAEPVLEVNGEKTPFKYRQAFKSREEMVQWASSRREDIVERCDFLDEAVRDWSLGRVASDLTALALHTHLVNTWWTTRKDGRDWFSVWEGQRYYHSPVDVEYNSALMYLALWPELLAMQLDQWAEFGMDGAEALNGAGKGTAFLCRDMGAELTAGRPVYPYHMEVEENADYLLMLAAWAAVVGDAGRARRKLPLCRRLAEFIVNADTDGNGGVNVGVANAIDDAGPALQCSRGQTYLAVKAQAALWALAEMEQWCDAKGSQAERWRAFASKSIKAVEDDAWLDDHYAITLDPSAEGLTDPRTGDPLPPGELAGGDGYSIYAANGLLYLLLSGVKMPRWRLIRFAEDMENAQRVTVTRYGCRHSSAGDRAVWFSQNLWRDFVAAYLGVDFLNNVERYWDYQLTAGSSREGALYCDAPEDSRRRFSPRGAAVFGMPLAAVGLRLNRRDGELSLQPLRAALRVPLLPLADWEQMRIPVLTVTNREGVSVARISERDLLEGLTLTVMGAEMEPEGSV